MLEFFKMLCPFLLILIRKQIQNCQAMPVVWPKL